MNKQIPIILWLLLISTGVPARPQATAPEARMKSWQIHQRLERESPFRDLEWRAVGPRFCGGRIESVAVHPDDPFTIYVGVGAGNIWKSSNNGVTWEPIFEHESTFTIGEVAIAPSDPNILYVGTGEVLMARSSYAGTGVFKSTDAGRTWENVGLHDSHHIGRVLIHPENPNIVYIAAIGHNFSYNQERGLFKTTDGGKTWDRILYISEKVGVIDVEMDPEDDSILYAAAWERDRKPWGHVAAGEGSALYRSKDAGRTWAKLVNGLPDGAHVGRIGVEIAPSHPETVYVLLENRTPRPETEERTERRRRPMTVGGEVYRSDDRGETWEKVNRDYLGTSIGYDWNLLRVSPDDENEIYVGGNRFLLSKDGGKSYTQIGGTVVHLLSKPKREFSLDQHALWIDPKNSDRIILGNDHGLYISYDRTRTWLHVNNLPITEFYAISVDTARPYNIYGGNQDNAAVMGPSTHTPADGEDDPWRYIYLDRWGGGDGFVTLADPTEPDMVYYFSGRSVFRKNMKTGEQGDNIAPQAREDLEGLRFNWMVPFFISPHDSSRLYYGANKVFRSDDKGETWTCISPDLTTDPGPDRQGNVPYGTLTTLSESPLEAGLMYAGSDDGNIQVTRDGGANWTLVNSGLPAKWVSRVTASHFEPGTVYATLTGYREDDFSSYVYLSTDFGKTWVSIASNLPAESANVIQEDPKVEGILYLGTDLGIYVTLDRGKTWHSLSSRLPTAPVHDLAVHPRDDELVIGTHGRSCFILDVEPIRERRMELME